MTTIYGIKQCDTCRKALRWLDDQGVAHQWRDVREQPLQAADISAWLAKCDWRTLVNKRSTTWRELSEAERNALDASTIVVQLLATPTLTKRPVLLHDDALHIGFSPARYAEIFGT